MRPIAGHYRSSPVAAELDRWRDAGRIARLWLRDDDAHEPSKPLGDLLARLDAHEAPCLLAIVPMKAGEALADALRGQSRIRVAMHGAWHANQAPAGRKSEETPDERGLGAIAAELGAARARLVACFGEPAGAWYVPPWNRIGASVAALLPQLGFRALSTFADQRFGLAPALAEINTHVDIVDWRNGRVGRSADETLENLSVELARARQQQWRSVGILTHHLAHDRQAWATLDAILNAVSAHDAAAWCDPDDLLTEAASA